MTHIRRKHVPLVQALFTLLAGCLFITHFLSSVLAQDPDDYVGDDYYDEEPQTGGVAMGDPVIEQLEYEHQLEFVDAEEEPAPVNQERLIGEEDDVNFEETKMKIIKELVEKLGLDMENPEDVKVEFVSSTDDLGDALSNVNIDDQTAAQLVAAANRLQMAIEDSAKGVSGLTQMFEDHTEASAQGTDEQYRVMLEDSDLENVPKHVLAAVYKVALVLNEGHDAFSAGDMQRAMEKYRNVLSKIPEDGDHLSVWKSVQGSATTGLAVIFEKGGQIDLPVNRTLAVELYQSGAALGNETAQFRMGTLHAAGALGVPKSAPLMVLNYQFAALGGHPGAQLALGYRHMMGIDVPKNCQTAAKWFEIVSNVAVDQVEKETIPGLNERFRLDFEGRQQLSASENDDVIDYYRQAADKGDVNAQVALGQLYYYGARGLTRDLHTARQFFRSASLSGDPLAQSVLGHLMLKGLGGSVDIRNAFGNFSASADAQHGGGLNGLGYLHLYGLGTKQDIPQAVSLFNAAADVGNSEAFYNLGALYVSGVGVPRRDYSKALHYFTLGAQKGHTLAMHKLAQMSLYGVGTHSSCESAVGLFKQVAERGTWIEELSASYRKCQAGDLEAALHGYLIAAEQGYEVAQSNAAYLLDRGVSLKEPQVEEPEERLEVTVEDEDGEADVVPGPFDSFLETFAAVHNSLGLDTSWIDDIRSDLGTGKGGVWGAVARWSDWLNQDALTIATSALEAHKEFLENVLGIPLETNQIGSTDALRLYEYAADQGNIAARLKIGDYYFYGIGGVGEPDYVQAAYHYRAASDNREPQAMFNLGMMYEYGFGLPRDFHLSKRYYDMAASTSPEAKYPVALALGKLWMHKVYRAAMYGEQVKELPRGILAVAAWVHKVRQGYLEETSEGSQEASAVEEGLGEWGGERWQEAGEVAEEPTPAWQMRNALELEEDWVVLMFLTFSLLLVTYIRWRRMVGAG